MYEGKRVLIIDQLNLFFRNYIVNPSLSANGIPIYGGQELNVEMPLDFRGRISMIAAQNTPTLTGVIWGVAE